MKVQVFRLFYKPDGSGFVPVDRSLFEMAEAYARQYITNPNPIDLLSYNNAWLACEVDGQGKPLRALGLLCMVMRVDFPVCRFTDNAACKMLVDRANDFVHDQGGRGSQVLVHIAKDEPADQRCPNYLDWMTAFGMKPADRFTFDIK